MNQRGEGSDRMRPWRTLRGHGGRPPRDDDEQLPGAETGEVNPDQILIDRLLRFAAED